MSRVINTKIISDTILFKRLQELEDKNTQNIFNNLENICQEACDRIKEMPRYASQYTLHDEVHFIRVTELMGLILGETLSKLNSLEILLLILSAYYHDQGMVPNSEEMAMIEKDERFIIFRDNWYLEHPNRNELLVKTKEPHIADKEKIRLIHLIQELDNAMLTDYLRITHGERGRELIKTKFENDLRLEVFNFSISRILGNLCQSHCSSVDDIIKSSDLNLDEQVGIYKINLKYLAAILRLADIMDFDRDRTPEILFKSIHFTSSISITEWEKHRGVQGWEISKNRIRFTLEFEHPVYEASSRKFLTWIDKELSDCKNMCLLFPPEQSHYQLLLPHSIDRTRIRAKANSYIYHDLEFSLSRDEIVKLLMTDKLYEDQSLCIRELLQNALDAIRFRKALFKCQDADWNVGEVKFEHTIDENGYEILKCKDNGVGMDEEIITKFFCKAGRSFYRSPEFERKRVEFRTKGVDFDPCAKFGIGFMSCFMIGDRITIQTKRDYGTGMGRPLIVEINGLGGMLVIKEGKANQEIGTTVTIQKREKTKIFDHWDDTIRLLDVIQGYALVTEFPIHAECKIEEIKGTVSIPTKFEKPITLLEETNIQGQKTIEFEFSKIDHQLDGIIRQSFLTDDSGYITLENHEASYIEKKETSIHKYWCIKLKNQKQEIDISRNSDKVTVCIDGILVAGKRGRESYRKKNLWRLGWNASPIHNNATALLDIRGEIKPELSPSRVPLSTRSAFETPPGWKRLQELLNTASGKIWNQVIEECAATNRQEEIWKLVIMYSASLQQSSTSTLLNFLPIPILLNEKVRWEKLENLSQIKFLADENSWNLYTLKNEQIDFANSLYVWALKGDVISRLKYQLLYVLIFASEISIVDNCITLNIKKKHNNSLPLNHNKFIELGFSNRCYFLDFINMDEDVVAIQSYLPLANRKHPLSDIALKNRFTANKDPLQVFASNFTIGIARSIKKDKKEGEIAFTLEGATQWKRRIANLYFDVSWDNYNDNLKAPYKIWTEKDGWLEISESILKEWASAKIQPTE